MSRVSKIMSYFREKLLIGTSYKVILYGAVIGIISILVFDTIFLSVD